MPKKRSFQSILSMLALSMVICIAMFGCKKEKSTESDSSAPSTSTSTSSAGSDEAAAYVNGEKILKSDLDAVVSMYSGGGGMGMHGGNQMSEESIKQLREKMLNQMIDGEILYQVSKKYPFEGLEEKAETEYTNIIKQYESEAKFEEEAKKNNLTIDKVKANLRKNLTIQNYIDTEVMSKIKISEEDMKKHYENNKSMYDTPLQVKASHILVKLDAGATKEQEKEAKAKIKKIQDRLKAGEDFAEVARDASEGPSAPRGGDLGFFGLNQMVKPFEEAAFALKVNEVSDVVQTEFGYHIIKLYDKKEAETKTFEEVKGSIEDSLKKQGFQDTLTNLIEKLRAEAKIEIIN